VTESLIGGVEKEPLVSGVARIYTASEDPIVYPTPPPPYRGSRGEIPC
jgi:hypothetical protein